MRGGGKKINNEELIESIKQKLYKKNNISTKINYSNVSSSDDESAFEFAEVGYISNLNNTNLDTLRLRKVFPMIYYY